MAFSRHKVRTSWHLMLKQDEVSRENGFHPRLFRTTEVYTDVLSFRDYPSRTQSRSWKDQRKVKHQWER